MLKQYELSFPQADIEYMISILKSRHLAADLCLQLNSVLTCEEDMCKNKRFGMTSFCADHPQEEIQRVEAA